MSADFFATAAVKQLQQQKQKQHSLRVLMKDEERNRLMYKCHEGVHLDFSRQLIDSQGVKALLQLAKERDVAGRVAAMFKGDIINSTEKRSVLHVALRKPRDSVLKVGNVDVVAEVHKVLDAIKDFSTAVRLGRYKGSTGKPLTNVICIGIGGSYLGSEFLVEALKTEPRASKAAEGRQIRFLANVDPVDLTRATQGLDPASTLVVIISKTFTTAETMLNARSIRQWLKAALKTDEAVGAHMCAVSTAHDKTSAFGITSDRVFGFWDWVGGRYSVTSAVGVLPLALHFGFDIVEELLRGCHAMDKHFLETPVEENLPMLMALVSVYNSSILGFENVAVLPYSQAMHRFAAHIQQLTMESNGKGVDSQGKPLVGPAGEVYFGEPGTNGQHSFYQLMHQGRVIPAELIGFKKSQNPVVLPGEPISNHDELMSNFFAQPDALAFGKTPEELVAKGVSAELVPHRTFNGNRPSMMLLAPECNAFYLGMILSLYENRVAAQGFLWGINSFDQFGVELGKQLAATVRDVFAQHAKGQRPDLKDYCQPTQRLLQEYLK